MGAILDKVKAFFGGAASTAAASASPVTAIAGAIGGVANAVTAVEQKADHKQLLDAGAAQGTLKDAAKTEERVADAAAAHGDERLRTDVENTRFRD